ncbi:GNAT family N-acetyltransferase [Fontibacillus phaseoli]|uniref:GNAT family N-acetyltransferase n=1 Tax=Fontibacillus phaseoli TaxID=1416533 RepID=UPI001FEA5A62|nr:GNAT family N-acetyltransferase [Fontibacillus phaseoli]
MVVAYDIEKKIYEIGFHLKSNYWGTGYASEAANAVIHFAFDQMKADNLFAGHNPLNLASKNLLLKLGFKYSHNEFYEPTGLSHPSYFYKL